MKEELIELIEISIIDNAISDKKRAFLTKKATEWNIDEEELGIFIDAKLHEKIKTKVSSIDIEERDRIKNPILYVFALIAFISPMLNWIKFSSKANVMGSSYSNNFEFSGMTGGLGYLYFLLFPIGCYMYYKRNIFWWILPVYALIHSFFVYNSLTTVNYSMDMGSYGSGSAGYSMLWPFYLFIGSTIVMITSGLFTSNNKRSKWSLLRNLSSMKYDLLLTFVLTTPIALLTFGRNGKEGFYLISAIYLILIFIFSIFLSPKKTRNIMVSLSILGLALFLYSEGTDFRVQEILPLGLGVLQYLIYLGIEKLYPVKAEN